MLCEKPLATSESDAKAVLDAEAAPGVGSSRWDSCAASTPATRSSNRSSPLIGSVNPDHPQTSTRNTCAAYGLVTKQTMTNMVIHEFDINRWLLGEDFTAVMVSAGKPGPLTPAGERDPLLVVPRSATGQFGYEVICRVTGPHGQAVSRAVQAYRTGAGPVGVDLSATPRSTGRMNGAAHVTDGSRPGAVAGHVLE
jgi:myo-inositol 2-dehydrogenase/D-chiro-inositol 1-dehydrogenase